MYVRVCKQIVCVLVCQKGGMRGWVRAEQSVRVIDHGGGYIVCLSVRLSGISSEGVVNISGPVYIG